MDKTHYIPDSLELILRLSIPNHHARHRELEENVALNYSIKIPFYKSYNFKYLSSNTLYQNNQPDIASLLAASATIPNGSVVEASEGLYEATLSSLSIPVANQYLYLIYDYRTTSSASICYDATNANEACCGCGSFCTPYASSTVQNTISIACVQPTNQTYYHDGTGALPVISDTVYSSTTCDDSATSTKLQAGYYEIGASNQWIRVNSGRFRGFRRGVGEAAEVSWCAGRAVGLYLGAITTRDVPR